MIKINEMFDVFHKSCFCASVSESKNLRIFETAKELFGAKIFRRASLAQDDVQGRVADKIAAPT